MANLLSELDIGEASQAQLDFQGYGSGDRIRTECLLSALQNGNALQCFSLSDSQKLAIDDDWHLPAGWRGTQGLQEWKQSVWAALHEGEMQMHSRHTVLVLVTTDSVVTFILPSVYSNSNEHDSKPL